MNVDCLIYIPRKIKKVGNTPDRQEKSNLVMAEKKQEKT